jgi:hypothetical protein
MGKKWSKWAAAALRRRAAQNHGEQSVNPNDIKIVLTPGPNGQPQLQITWNTARPLLALQMLEGSLANVKAHAAQMEAQRPEPIQIADAGVQAKLLARANGTPTH